MQYVIPRNEESPLVARQRLEFRCGVTCEDFSFVEMTRCVIYSGEIASFLAMTYFAATFLCGVTCGDSSFLGM